MQQFPTELDFTRCDHEQIQYAGAIQPHGALLVLQEPDLRILQVSANTVSYLGIPPDVLLGQNIEIALGKEAIVRLRLQLSIQDLSASLLHLMTVRPIACKTSCHLFGNRPADGLLLLEFERLNKGARRESFNLYQEVHRILHRLQSALTLQIFFDSAVTEIQALTGFERVMAYRFAADGSGEVIAEAVQADLETYLGLHYPAVDIPEPARRLFRLTWLRHLPHVDYHSIPLIPEINPLTGAPVDLSYSFLRSVSLMYTGYLQNMGVKATLVITLLKEGKLWGLISCMHHTAPRYLPYETRMAVECLGHMVSLLMGEKEAKDHYAYRLTLGATRERLLDTLLQTNALHQALIETHPEILTILNAGGVALLSDDRLSLIGCTPTEPQIRALADWLSARDSLWFASHQLPMEYPPAAAFQSVASGLLAVRWSSAPADSLMWFRPEWQQVVNWAGNPHKPVETNYTTGDIRLLPRSSFAIWREIVAGQSRRWLDCEIEHAAELRRGIVEFILRHAEQIQRMNRELVESNLELDTFAYAASHDLKEPLRGIHTSIEFFQEDDGERISSSGKQRLATILKLTQRMDELIESLLQYSRIGRMDLQMQTVDLNGVLAQILETLALVRQMPQGTVRVLDHLPMISCDRVRVSEIFSNLISNALKYNDHQDKQVEIGCDNTLDPPVFFVRDNGIGIAEKHVTRIFQIFRRLHGRDEYGGGTGAGLTITKKAIERHGGRIWVESILGKGSTFRFTLAPPAKR